MRLLATLVFLHRLCVADPAATAIERAQEHTLKKDRARASLVLRRAIEAAPSRAARARLGEALAQITRIFFTDRGQQEFESGQTALFETPAAALVHLTEALRHEDGNVAVRLAIARYYLLAQDCSNAATEVAAARQSNPIDGEAAALELRVAICRESAAVDLRDKVRRLPPLDKWQNGFVTYVQARELLRQGLSARAADALGRVVAEFPRFPEARFYLGRAEAARGTGGDESLRKYVSLCKGFTGRDRREFALEPRVCLHRKEAEDELAKRSTEL